MNRTFYKKVVSTNGRVKYVPTHEYDDQWSHAMPTGCHMVVVKPGTRSQIYNIDPDMATLLAAFKMVKEDFVTLLLENSKLKPKDAPLTDAQREAWNQLSTALGESSSILYGPSLNEVAEKVGDIIIKEAAELLKNPAVKKAWDNLQTIAVLSK